MHEKLGRFDVQLFADIFTDFDQIPATLSTVAGLGFVAMFDTRQMIG